MKKISNLIVGAALMASLPAQALAASIEDAPQHGRDSQTRGSSFAGARIRLAMGGHRKQERLRAGLTFAAMQSGRSARGYAVTSFSDGVELGVTGSEPVPHLSVAGYRLTSKLNAGEGQSEEKKKRGNGLRTAAFVVGGILVAGAIGFGIFVHEAQKNSR